MYYDLSVQAKSSHHTEGNSLAIGPLYISAQQVGNPSNCSSSLSHELQIGIGVMMQLLSLVPNIFIIQFFRRIRPRDQISPLEKALKKIHPSSRM